MLDMIAGCFRLAAIRSIDLGIDGRASRDSRRRPGAVFEVLHHDATAHGWPLPFGSVRPARDPRAATRPPSLAGVRVRRGRPTRSPTVGTGSDADARGAHPTPIGDGPFEATVSTDGSLAAFASLDRTVVTAADGTIQWHRESVIKRQGMPQTPAVHIDRAGRLWLYAPDGGHLAVMDAQTGNEIDRTRLSSYRGRRVRSAPRRSAHRAKCGPGAGRHEQLLAAPR
jgi:hypothetical protein